MSKASVAKTILIKLLLFRKHKLGLDLKKQYKRVSLRNKNNNNIEQIRTNFLSNNSNPCN